MENELKSQWFDWEWQQKNAVSSVESLTSIFPNLPSSVTIDLQKYATHLRFKLTPYLLSLIQLDEKGNPLLNDPILNQFVPFSEGSLSIANGNSLSENWELPEDMVTPIFQHKHKNRALFRIQNSCLSYCMYCFEAKRVLDKQSEKKSFRVDFFSESIQYLETNLEIEEVIISGGEPLVLPNSKLKYIIEEVSKINHIKSIRIHTRAVTHNPFRIDNDLVEIISNEKVNCINIHVVHPNEISEDFIKAIKKLQKGNVLILAHTPLLKNINDDHEILKNLFMKLYTIGVKPYYLLHAMPETILSDKFRTSVLDGVNLIRRLKRFYSNPAIPEYIIVHEKGKQTVPLEPNSTPEFIYENGQIKFKNWAGEWCIYLDKES
jgi:lysine 2,3-aminomutase